MFFALLSSLILASAPVGDSLLAMTASDTVSTRSKVQAVRHIDTIEYIHHGALEGSKVLTPGDSLLSQWIETLRDNVLHSRTKRSTVERRLLIARGDVLDSARLQESERVLRLERFLADIKIRDTLLADGRTLVRVETWDRWSSSIPVSPKLSGGVFTWALGVRESNLLGTGQDVSASYGQNDGSNGWTLGYANSALFMQGLKLDVVATVLSNGHTTNFDFGVPALHRYQNWAWGIKGVDQSNQRDVYAPPEVARALTQRIGASWAKDSRLSSASDSKYREVRASLTRLWGDEIRLQASILAESQLDSSASPIFVFGIPASQLTAAHRDPMVREWLQRPGHRDDRRLGMELTLKEVRYLRLRNFNNLKWTEDIPLGWSTTATGAWNVLSRGEIRDAGYVQLLGNWTGMVGNLYGSGSGGWKNFVDQNGNLAQGNLSLRTNGRWLAHQTLHLLGGISCTTSLGAPGWIAQTTLGEENGLPGWPARSIAGRGRLLTTGELRFIPPLEALTMAPALAVFGGAGKVSLDADPLGSGPWRAGVGVGIRLGMTRSLTGLINHLSLSHPVGETDREMGWLLSFGAYKSL